MICLRKVSQVYIKVYFEENNVYLQGNATKNIFIFRFSGKAEPKLEGLTTKFHHLPLEKLCTKFGAFVRP